MIVSKSINLLSFVFYLDLFLCLFICWADFSQYCSAMQRTASNWTKLNWKLCTSSVGTMKSNFSFPAFPRLGFAFCDYNILNILCPRRGWNGKTECSMTVRQLPTIFPGFSYCHIAVDEYVDVQAADSNAIFLGERCVAWCQRVVRLRWLSFYQGEKEQNLKEELEESHQDSMRTAGDGIISNCVYAFAMQQKEEAHRVTSCGRSLMYATAASKFLIFFANTPNSIMSWSYFNL